MSRLKENLAKLTFIDILILALIGAFLIIGLDQSLVLGFENGYWAFMIALALFFIYNYRKNKKPPLRSK